MSQNIQAIIFDVDGTLLDTTEFIYQAFEYTFRTYAIPLISREELSVHMGTQLEDVYTAITSDQDADTLSHTHREFQKNNAQLIHLYPEVVDTLRVLKDRGLKLGAVTSRKQSATQSLAWTGLLDLFGVVVAGTDVQYHKPHPEGIAKALEVLRVSPDAAVMVGDTVADIIAGQNAGVAATIGVTYGFYGKKIVASHPDYTIESFGELAQLPLFQ